MSVEPFFMFITIALFAVVIVWLNKDSSKICCGITMSIFATLALVFIISLSQPDRVKKTLILPVHMVDNVQIVQYLLNEEVYIVNLNQEFQCYIDQNDLIEVTLFENGPYFGLYYKDMKPKYAIKRSE